MGKEKRGPKAFAPAPGLSLFCAFMGGLSVTAKPARVLLGDMEGELGDRAEADAGARAE